MEQKSKKILLTGGGTGGSVTPLLAIAEELRSASEPGSFDFFWIGTKKGVEKEMVERAGIIFKPIYGGKLRRFFSFRNFSDIFFIKLGFLQSIYQMIKWRPDLIITAGSFISVPVIWAGWLLRIPIIVHQQDVRPGLANKLMSPFARVITVTFEKSLVDYGKKSRWTGNPVREEIQNAKRKVLSEESKLPTIFVLGGGTGADFINKLVNDAINKISEFSVVVHVTGKNKLKPLEVTNYKSAEFLNASDMAEAFARADIVVTRAGMGTLTELSFLAKPSIIIPIPQSHQEDNADIFHEAKAAIVLKQADLTPEVFIKILQKLVEDKKLWEELSENIGLVMKKEANKEVMRVIGEILS